MRSEKQGLESQGARGNRPAGDAKDYGRGDGETGRSSSNRGKEDQHDPWVLGIEHKKGTAPCRLGRAREQSETGPERSWRDGDQSTGEGTLGRRDDVE